MNLLEKKAGYLIEQFITPYVHFFKGKQQIMNLNRSKTHNLQHYAYI